MRIVQIAPEVTTGSGVEAVAYHLEQEWRRAGAETARFTLADAGGGWLPAPGPGALGKATLAARVVWFSTAGTIAARRSLSHPDPDTVTICHNDVLFGDVYVNHGIVAEAMRARGRPAFRMIRNPLHLFTWLRDAVRFASQTHHVVVNLTSGEVDALRHTYPRVKPGTVVIGNGVDIERYEPGPRREDIRGELGLGGGDVVALFVGHEFDRKGLPVVLDSLLGTPANLHLVVVGGTQDMVADGQGRAAAAGLGGRVHFVGRQADPRPYFGAADFFVFPSAYESYGLVVLEALACGLPVVATRVGCVPDVLVDGVNGVVVARDAESVRDGMLRLLGTDRTAMGVAARRTAEAHSWPEVAQRYLDLFADILASRTS